MKNGFYETGHKLSNGNQFITSRIEAIFHCKRTSWVIHIAKSSTIWQSCLCHRDHASAIWILCLRSPKGLSYLHAHASSYRKLNIFFLDLIIANFYDRVNSKNRRIFHEYDILFDCRQYNILILSLMTIWYHCRCAVFIYIYKMNKHNVTIPTLSLRITEYWRSLAENRSYKLLVTFLIAILL